MKRLLLLFGLQLCISAWAEDNVKNILRVQLKDGTQNEYIISDRPEVQFENSKVVFSCKNVTTEYAKDNLINFIFTSDYLSISPLQSGDTRLTIMDDGNLLVEGAKDVKSIKVYSIDGKILSVKKIYNEGSIIILLASLPKGCYIININKNQSVKVIR